MKQEIKNFNRLIENKSVSEIIIRQFLLFHESKAEILLLTDINGIRMRFNFMTHFCGDLHVWKKPLISLTHEIESIIFDGRKIPQPVFALYDSNNDFYVKSSNLELLEAYDAYRNGGESYCLQKEKTTRNKNLNAVNNELSLYDNSFIWFPNSTVDDFTIQLEKRYTPAECHGSYGIFTKAALIIKCYGNTFLKGQFLTKIKTSISIHSIKNKYVFTDKNNEFRLECQEFVFIYPDEHV